MFLISKKFFLFLDFFCLFFMMSFFIDRIFFMDVSGNASVSFKILFCVLIYMFLSAQVVLFLYAHICVFVAGFHHMRDSL